MLAGDKDSSVIILNKSDYLDKIYGLLNEGITKGTYVPCEDTILTDLKKFQDFIRYNFKKHKEYENMRRHTKLQNYNPPQKHTNLTI